MSPESAPLIRCEGVSFAYPDGTRALDSIDLAIARGERVAIVGSNGSGKSTLVRLWNGLLRPTAGDVSVDGRPIAGRRVAELARTIGLTTQDPDDQLFSSTCRAEVEFGARNVGLRGGELRGAVDGGLVSVGLLDHAATNPFDLGGSQRRLLTLACVLAMRTQVVVLDEPTMGLDRAEIDRVAALIETLAGEGRTVVAISHDAHFVERAFQRAIRLDAGRVVADGSPALVLRS